VVTGGTITVTLNATTGVDYVGNVDAMTWDNSSFTDAKTGNYYITHYGNPTYGNITSSQAGRTAFAWYEPASLAGGGFSNYGFVANTNVLSGVGGVPTGTWDIRGSGSNVTLRTQGAGTGTNYTMRSFQSDGTTEIYSQLDNGSFIYTPKINASAIIGSWTATANSQYNLHLGGSFTSRNTNNDILYGYVIDPTLTVNAGAPTGQTLYGLYINPTFSGTATKYALGLNADMVFASGGIKGYTDASTAGAGIVGEVLSGQQSTYTNYTTTATYQQIASVTLTAGDWDIWALGTLSTNSATVTANANTIFVISTTTASAAGSTEGQNIVYIDQGALTLAGKQSTHIMAYRVSISSSTTYYLNSQATFTLGNPQFVGTIYARRRR
jgi:hypothetical protein